MRFFCEIILLIHVIERKIFLHIFKWKFLAGPDMERSGMGFSVMEAFMDRVKVESALGKGTRIRLEKELRQVECDG